MPTLLWMGASLLTEHGICYPTALRSRVNLAVYRASAKAFKPQLNTSPIFFTYQESVRHTLIVTDVHTPVLKYVACYMYAQIKSASWESVFRVCFLFAFLLLYFTPPKCSARTLQGFIKLCTVDVTIAFNSTCRLSPITIASLEWEWKFEG